MKYLVIENLDEIEVELGKYISTLDQTKNEFKIFYNADKAHRITDLLQELCTCDGIILQSTFHNMTQFESLVDIISKLSNIKEIRVLYTYNKASDDNKGFLRFINNLEKPVYNKIKQIMNNCNIYDIALYISEDSTNRSYFKKLDYYFDTVQLYHSDKVDMIWHTRKPNITLPSDILYKFQYVDPTVNVINKKAGDLNLTVEEEDKEIFLLLLKEMDAVLNFQIESCKDKDFGNSVELIEEKEKMLKVLWKLLKK